MTLLSARGLTKHFWLERAWSRRVRVRALEDVGFDLAQGESLGIVGESGSGKTTLARILAGFLKPDGGRLSYEGRPREAYRRAEWAARVQMVFQDPAASLNPKLSVRTLLAEPIRQRALWDGRPRAGTEAAVAGWLTRVGLPPDILAHYPHQFSGGQRQRIAIARALAAEPRLVIADEPVSALDLSVQAQILNLLADLRAEMGLALILISHDLTVVRQMTDRVLILERGRLAESGDTEAVLAGPRHAATRALLDAVPALLR